MQLLRAWICCCVFSLSLWPATDSTEESNTYLLALGDSLYCSGNYDAAVTEYLRYLFFYPQTSIGFYVDFRIGNAYVAMKRPELAVSWLRKSLLNIESAAFRPIIRYRLALALAESGQIDAARIEFFKLANQPLPDSLMIAVNTMFTALSMKAGDWRTSAKSLQDLNTLNDDNDLYQEAAQFASAIEKAPAPRSPRIAKWLSTVVPGSGQIYAGEAINGLNALAISAATGFLVYREVREKDYSDAGLLFALLWLRFYNGNRHQAEQAAIRHNRLYQAAASQKIRIDLRQGLLQTGESRIDLTLRQVLGR